MIVTLGAMVTRARRLAKQENSTFASDEEVKSLLLTGIQDVRDTLHGDGGQEWERSTAEIVTTPGQAIYDLPTDYYRLKLLSASTQVPSERGGGGWNPSLSDLTDWRGLWPFNLDELPLLLNNTSGDASNAMYRLRGKQGGTGGAGSASPVRQVEIRPTPRVEYTLRLEYLPRTVVPSADAYEVDGLNGFEMIPILQAAICLLQMEESDASGLREWLGREQARLTAVASGQDQTRPERVADTAGILDPIDGYGGFFGRRWRRW